MLQTEERTPSLGGGAGHQAGQTTTTSQLQKTPFAIQGCVFYRFISVKLTLSLSSITIIVLCKHTNSKLRQLNQNNFSLIGKSQIRSLKS